MKLKEIRNTVVVAFFLASRTVRRSNKYITGLIILILTLIFLNLVAIGGLLIGLIQSGNVAFYTVYSGSIMVKPLLSKTTIQRTDELLSFAKSLPGYVAYSPRINSGAKLELDWRGKEEGSAGNSISASVVGLDPALEAQTTILPTKIVEGRFLVPGDTDSIVIGSTLAGVGATFSIGETLQNVEIGKKILVTYSNGASKEYTIVGILETKVQTRNNQAFVTLQEMKKMMGVTDQQYDEISIKTNDPLNPEKFQNYFIQNGYTNYNQIETWQEEEGSALNNINVAFTLIGNIIGGIGLMVGGITIFILIFVNAVTKRKFIGILKASGVNSATIVLSYIFQAIVYTIIGVAVGMSILYGFLIPYFIAHPIDFPFSDVTLYVTNDYVIARIIILFFVSFIAGLIPAYLIAKENTLDAILGR